MENEVWKDVVGYEGSYQVSNLGNVKSLKRKQEIILKPSVGSSGYYIKTLWKKQISKTYTIHQLVAKAFLGHKPCGMNLVIDHINNDKLDNRAENLQIVSHRFNVSKSNKNKCNISSKYHGVSIAYVKRKLKNNVIKYYKKIESQISINGQKIYLGVFKTEEEAHLAYQNALKKYKL